MIILLLKLGICIWQMSLSFYPSKGDMTDKCHAALGWFVVYSYICAYPISTLIEN